MLTNNENLGPADRIIQTVIGYTDHAVHNRPGLVTPDARFNTGVRWEPVTHKEENGQKVVYRLTKVGHKSVREKIGVMGPENKVKNDRGQVVGEYRPAGLFPEVVAWMYGQIAEVWKLDNEFAARWASYQYGLENRDLKVILSAFMLVQGRRGDPVKDGDKIAFYDDDFRDVGEAMMLLHGKDGKDLNPKLLLRIRDVLCLPQVAEINRKLGFGNSARKPFLGRWEKAIEKWLKYREENPKMLEGLVKAGFRTTVMDLARAIGYKPENPRFFDILRWKQVQSKDGRRTLSIGKAVTAAETWEGLSEETICQKIVKEKPNFKRIVGLLPSKVGMTRAVVAASIEAGSMSDKDLIIYTPTLEELGLLQVQNIRERWESAVKKAEDMRAANIATRVKSKDTAEKLQEAADTAIKKAVEEVIRGLRVYFFVDISGSMDACIPTAKEYIAKFLQAFPVEQIHTCVFNTEAREIAIKNASAAGVANAFRGIGAGGGTDYGAGVRALSKYKPTPEEDVLFIFVGDEEALNFAPAVRASGLNPMAFGFVKVKSKTGPNGVFARQYEDKAVRETAADLGVPCFMIDNATFADPYAIPRTIRALVAATPVTKRIQPTPVIRKSLLDTILETKLLQKPTWAA